MSYSQNLQLQIESNIKIIEKCHQELSLKSIEPHMQKAWEDVLQEANENLSRLGFTSSMTCFFG